MIARNSKWFSLVALLCSIAFIFTVYASTECDDGGRIEPAPGEEECDTTAEGCAASGGHCCTQGPSDGQDCDPNTSDCVDCPFCGDYTSEGTCGDLENQSFCDTMISDVDSFKSIWCGMCGTCSECSEPDDWNAAFCTAALDCLCYKTQCDPDPMDGIDICDINGSDESTNPVNGLDLCKLLQEGADEVEKACCRGLTYQEFKDMVCCFVENCGEDAFAPINLCTQLRSTLEFCAGTNDAIPACWIDELISEIDAGTTGCTALDDESSSCTDCCTTNPSGPDYWQCGSSFDCDPNNDGMVDCNDLREFVENSLCCITGDPTRADIIDLICIFLDECDTEWDGNLCQELIDCVEDIICEIMGSTTTSGSSDVTLTEAELDEIMTCAGCTAEDCCSGVGTGGAKAFTCGSNAKCDFDCDGDVDCLDLQAFYDASTDLCTQPSTPTKAEKLDIICEFLKGVESQDCDKGRLCEDILDCILATIGETTLTSQEIADLEACSDCPAMSDPGNGSGYELNIGNLFKLFCEDEGKETDGNPNTEHPVNIWYGDKVERAVDLRVRVTGRDFVFSREYSSSPDFFPYGVDPAEVEDPNPLVGNNWTASPFYFFDYDDGDGSTTCTGCPTGGPYEQQCIDICMGSTLPADILGPVTQNLVATFVEVDSVKYPVWRVSEPGQWEMDFHRQNAFDETIANGYFKTPVAMYGLLFRTRDMYSDTGSDDEGNVHEYRYSLYGLDQDSVRLKTVTINHRDGGKPEARVDFHWIPDQDSTNFGKLERMEVIRFDNSTTPQEVMTQYVEYTYMDESKSFSPDLGTDGDLIQVAHYERVDPDPGQTAATWRERITQYRYHGNTDAAGSVTIDDQRDFDWTGGERQLKMCIEPEQIEYYAQKVNSGATTPVLPTNAANDLLGKHDGMQLFQEGTDWFHVVDLASKVIEEYESTGDKRVKTQYLQSACGCAGGGTQGTRLTYEYFSYSSGDAGTTRVSEWFYDTVGSDWDLNRRINYDIELLSSVDVPFLRTKAVWEDTDEDGTLDTGESMWVTRYEHDADQNVSVLFTPSAMETGNYAPSEGDSDPPTFTATTVTGGLVYAYDYSTDNRTTELRIHEGYDADFEDFDIISRTTYGSTGTGDERDYLPKTIEQFRTSISGVNPTPAVNDVEVTEFAYKFHFGDAIAYVQTKVEAELTGENGPGGLYYSHEFYDERGNNHWSHAADNCLTMRTFESPTATANGRSGGVLTVERNVDNTGFPTLKPDPTGLPFDFNGRNGDGGALLTEYKRDLLGRVQERITPGGISTYTRREMAEIESRPGLLYYRVVTLPHELITGSGPDDYNGPATITWYNAGGSAIGSSDYQVKDPSGTSSYDINTSSPMTGYFSIIEDYDFEPDGSGGVIELARQRTSHDLSGLVEKTEVWHDVAGDDHYDTMFSYDQLGRLEESINAVGTTKHNDAYDVLDRVLKVKIGTSGGTMQTVAEIFYDHTGGTSSPAQGVGNGNVTLVRQHIGASGADRDTQYIYDFRDRPIARVNPAAPHHIAVEYDNLDRVTKRATFEYSSIQTTPPTDPTSNTNRKLYTELDYSQRGLVYRQAIAITPTDASPDFLESHTFYDEVGRTIGALAPNKPRAKITYDGLGRPEVEYTTDGQESGGGEDSTYSDWYNSTTKSAVVTDDTVLEQREYSYIEDTASAHVGMLELVSTKRKVHTSGSGMIATYAGSFYDKADRIVRSANYGTADSGGFVTGSTAPTINQSTHPSSTDTVLVSVTKYNARNLVETSTSPDGEITRFEYDDMNRRTAVIENYQDGQSPALNIIFNETEDRWEITSGINTTDPEEDRVTSFVYDGINNIVKQVAHLPDGSAAEVVQITEYDYGVTTSGGDASEVASNDLLSKVHYPQESGGSAGEPGTTAEYTVTYAYNRQGELIFLKDQNETEHDYTRDDHGRVTLDEATLAVGSDIDGTIEAIETLYDDLGRAEFVKSYSDYSMSTVANAVEFTYTPLWQIRRIIQDPTGDVTLSSLRSVYSYDNDDYATGDNFSRVSSLEYPNGQSISYSYNPYAYAGGTRSVDDRISRVAQIGDTGGTFVAYDFIGMSMTAIADYVVPDVQLSRYFAHDGTTTTGEYPGYDRFGRVQRQLWVDGGFDNTPSNTFPDIPPIVEVAHSYDRDSNRLTSHDERPVGGSGGWPHSFEYSYDGLDRLTEAERGEWDGTTFTVKDDSQLWHLDVLGNWNKFYTDTDGDGTYEALEKDERTHDSANQLLGRDTDDDSTDERSYVYDAVGNLREIDKNPVSGTNKHIYTHDAWNRLVKVEFDNGTTQTSIGEYEYYGTHWRAVRRADSTADQTIALDQERFLFYDASWRLIEERIDDETSFTGDPTDADIDRHMQYIWGTRYIDDIVCRRVNSDFGNDSPSITYEDEWYHLTDVQFSTVAIIDDTADLVERISYSAYGVARHHHPGDVDGDGDVDGNDTAIISTIATGGNNTIGDSAYIANADLNRDGQILTASDRPGPTTAALGEGYLSSTDNIVGYDGYLFNIETQHYAVRFRHYAPELGRWIERDPAGYTYGANLYLALSGDPVSRIDPLGLIDKDHIFSEDDLQQWLDDHKDRLGGNALPYGRPPVTGIWPCIPGFPTVYRTINELDESAIFYQKTLMTTDGVPDDFESGLATALAGVGSRICAGILNELFFKGHIQIPLGRAVTGNDQSMFTLFTTVITIRTIGRNVYTCEEICEGKWGYRYNPDLSITVGQYVVYKHIKHTKHNTEHSSGLIFLPGEGDDKLTLWSKEGAAKACRRMAIDWVWENFEAADLNSTNSHIQDLGGGDLNLLSCCNDEDD